MSRDPSFAELMAQLRKGENQAAAHVFHRFASRLVALARKQLDPKILQKVDPEDVMQSVFRSFFTRNAAGQLGEFESWDNLWGMLVVMTQRKCGRRIDYFHAARRDVQLEVQGQPPEEQSRSDWGISDDEPTPSEAAMLTETIERLMKFLQGRHREILALSLQGYSAPEISAQVSCTERTVYRVLDRVKEWLESTRVDEPV